jgi:hypothetical protein
MTGTFVEFLLFVVAVQVLFGCIASWLSKERGHSGTVGFFLGLFLSGVGILVAALLPRSVEVQAKEAIDVPRAMGR